MYLRHPCRLRLYSRLRATPVVVGSLATVPPGDRFLSPIPDERGSYERGLRSTLVYQLEFFSLNVLLIWVPGHNSVPGNVTIFFFYHSDGMLLHIMGVRLLLVYLVTGHSVVLSNYILSILPQ